MTTRQLEASVRNRDGLTVVDLDGDIDAFAEEALNGAYAAVGGGPDPLLLNFERVGYINSTGIALIVGLLAKARQQDRRVVTFGLSEHYEEIFQITRLADFMSIFPDEQSALDGLNRSDL